MSKRISEKERKIRKFVAGVGKSAKGVLDAYSWLKSPHIKAAEAVADKMSKADSGRKIRGYQRNRVQYVNPRTGKWVKMDTRTGKIVGHKKDYAPYKNVRKGGVYRKKTSKTSRKRRK